MPAKHPACTSSASIPNTARHTCGRSESPSPGDPSAPKRDPDAEKLLAWMQDERRSGQWLTRDAIVKRFDEFGLTERGPVVALARVVETGVVESATGKQYGERGRNVTRFRLQQEASDK